MTALATEPRPQTEPKAAPATGTAPHEAPADVAPTDLTQRRTAERFDPRVLELDPLNHRHGDDDQPPTPEFLALVRTVLPEDAPDPRVQPDADLIESVRQSGVHSPVHVRRTATRTGDGERVRLGIFAGQRRWLAALVVAAEAVAAGRDVPGIDALVYDDLSDYETLLRSAEENDHRQDTTVRDDLRTLQQLDLLGMTQTARTKAARRLGRRPEEIAAAKNLAAADNGTIARATAADFDILEMAQYAEVADLSHALYRLRTAKERDARNPKGGRGHWAHALQELRGDKAEADRRAAAVAALGAAGVPQVAHHAVHDKHTRPLADLRTPFGSQLTAETHRACPGHAAALTPETYEPVWLCTNWKRHYHLLTPEAKRADAEATPATETEDEKRRVKAGNRAWQDARTVRLAFLRRTVAASGPLPEGLWLLALRMITGQSKAYAETVTRRTTAVLAELLAAPDPNVGRTQWSRVEDPFADVVTTTAKSRRGHLLWAHAAAVYEEAVTAEPGTWRCPTDDAAAYLATLAEHGYVLSEIEQHAIDEAAARAERLRQAEQQYAERNIAADQPDHDQGNDGSDGQAPEDEAASGRDEAGAPEGGGDGGAVDERDQQESAEAATD
ncbi:ParB N-terminal domain-containing protein (plasmid) [Streptomycetaceae bacterium NBC_01309]